MTPMATFFQASDPMSTELPGRLIEQGHGWRVNLTDGEYNWNEFLVTGSSDAEAAKVDAKTRWPDLDILKIESLGYGQVRVVEVNQWFPSNAPRG